MYVQVVAGPHKHEDPTHDDFWDTPLTGPLKWRVASLCSSALQPPRNKKFNNFQQDQRRKPDKFEVALLAFKALGGLFGPESNQKNLYKPQTNYIGRSGKHRKPGVRSCFEMRVLMNLYMAVSISWGSFLGDLLIRALLLRSGIGPLILEKISYHVWGESTAGLHVQG